MRGTPEASAGRIEYPAVGAPGRRAIRITEPDSEGNRFIVALGSDGREHPPSAAETGAYAREGA